MIPHWSIQVKTPPTEEPVSASDAAAFLRLDGPTAEDTALLTSLISAARRQVELLCNISLMPQTLRMSMDRFWRPERYGWYGWYYPQNLESPYAFHDYPAYEKMWILLPHPPVTQINQITYYDTSAVLQTLDPTLYVADFDSQPPRIGPAMGTTWPATAILPATVFIEYEAGYPVDPSGTDSVPEGVKTAIKYLVAHWYEQRLPVAAGAAVEVPMTVQYMLDPYKVFF